MEENKRKMMGITIMAMNNTAMKLDKIFTNNLKVDKHGGNYMCIPSSVLMAHTCELCIKAILDNQGLDIEEKIYQVHELNKLFAMIDKKTQDIIIKDTKVFYTPTLIIEPK